MGRVVNPILHATEKCLQKGDVRTPVSPEARRGHGLAHRQVRLTWIHLGGDFHVNTAVAGQSGCFRSPSRLRGRVRPRCQGVEAANVKTARRPPFDATGMPPPINGPPVRVVR